MYISGAKGACTIAAVDSFYHNVIKEGGGNLRMEPLDILIYALFIIPGSYRKHDAGCQA